MKAHRLAAAGSALLAAAILSACSSPSSSAGVPSLSSAGATGAAAGGDRVAALHAAAKCIREHGAPTYQDPVLTADGRVFTDTRSLENLGKGNGNGNGSTDPLQAIRQACATLIAAAGLRPEDEPPAPAKLVQAGVKAAQCMRAHGLPNKKDPTSATHYTPGHGFGMELNEIPAGGKLSPGFQQARQACAQLLNEEIRQSTLGNLGRG